MASIESWVAALIISQIVLFPLLGLVLFGMRVERQRIERKRKDLIKTYMMYSRGRRWKK